MTFLITVYCIASNFNLISLNQVVIFKVIIV
jgi:hypothetical protein